MEINLSQYPVDVLVNLQQAIRKEIRSRKVNSNAQKRTEFAKSLKPLSYPNREAAHKAIREHNRSGIMELPLRKGDTPPMLAKYLPDLLAQDWSSLYKGSPSQEFYVYAHVDPRARIFVTTSKAGGNYGGKPFYIGKGKNERAYELKRNQGHGKRIKEITGAGYGRDAIVYIIFQKLTEAQALEAEAKLIYFFGTEYDTSRHGWLLNLEEPKAIPFVGRMHRYPIARQFKDAE